MNFIKKKESLVNLLKQLNDPIFSNKLVNAYMNDTGFLIENIQKREIKTPILMIEELCEKLEIGRKQERDLDYFEPIGEVAVILPSNAINLVIAKAICSSFIAGNKTIVKFPRKLKKSIPFYTDLILNNLYDVTVESSPISSSEFLQKCIRSNDINCIVIYGDDKWVWEYKDLIRQSNTKFIFEGPGKDPQIVLENANIDLAVKDAISCGLLNGGQSCSAFERFFVHESLVEDFSNKLVEKLSNLKFGMPDDLNADIGPIKSEIIIERLKSQVEDATNYGAKILIGGEIIKLQNSHLKAFSPTVLTNCNTEMKILREENFGPVFPIISFNSEKDLINKVDDCKYGLNASIYGNPSDKLFSHIDNTHRNLCINSAFNSPENHKLQLVDGGYKNSGFIWKRDLDKFYQIEGKRFLIKELSS